MEENQVTIGKLMLLIATIMLIVACGTTPDDFEKAKQACGNQGGLKKYIHGFLLGPDEALCVNGNRIMLYNK